MKPTTQVNAELLLLYLNGQATEEQKQAIASWALMHPENQKTLDRLITKENLREDLRDYYHLIDGDPGKQRIERMRQAVLRSRNPEAKKSISFKAVLAAASILLIGSLFLYLKSRTDENTLKDAPSLVQLTPMGKGVMLTLTGGKVIDLEDTKEGIVMEGAAFSYQGDSSQNKLIASSKSENTLLTISTPNGEMFNLTLSDGTRIWLNAATKLEYPLQFSPDNRTVKLLEGEAYFEVAKSKVPFHIISKNQDIKVLGTHFNVKSYGNDIEQTALFEGSVQVSTLHSEIKNTKTLVPGQQAQVVASEIQISPADMERTLAWKNGDFVFRDMSAKQALMEIGRWYNMEVVFSSAALQHDFIPGGILKREKKLKDILDIISKSSDLTFTIQGRRIYVN